jgi:glycine/D-amino acid oxidase-like deaminating enzyme
MHGPDATQIVDNLQSSVPMRAPLPSAAGVVIIGGGIVGLSAAFHLAEAGADVVLVERGALGSGSTSKAAGGVRAQFSDALNIAIAQRSLAAYKAFGRRPGWEIDFRQVGYLFVLTRAQDVATFERSIALQQGLGVPSRLIGPEEAKALCPLIEIGDVLAAAYSPEDGHATPEAVVQGYASGARALGAHLRTGCEARAIEVRGGEIAAVVTSAGTIRTGTVICAAGAWSRAVGELAGVELPVSALRREVMFTEPMDGLPERLPLTIDFASTLYFHREGPGLLFGMADPERALELAERRAPALASAGIQGGWAGFYDMSPDHNAIIGEAPHVSRFLYATGFSGHGFLQGPATGELLRDLVLRQPAFVDAAPLAVERFDGRPLAGEFNFV